MIRDENGNRKYYYYKKKRGPRKKRGRKKKKPAPKKCGRKPIPKPIYNYKIIICKRHSQYSLVGKYETIKEVMEVKEKLLENNKNIIFPRQYVNNKNDAINCSEYVILEKKKDEDDNVTKLANEYGKLVEHKSTSKKWKIYDKFVCVDEETFWVYGYSNVYERKTIVWVKDNLFFKPINEDEHLILRVAVYQNKLLIRKDNLDFDMVICKNRSDCIRLYNFLRNDLINEKRIVFAGMARVRSQESIMYANMIIEKTGWSPHKVHLSKTRY